MQEEANVVVAFIADDGLSSLSIPDLQMTANKYIYGAQLHLTYLREETFYIKKILCKYYVMIIYNYIRVVLNK